MRRDLSSGILAMLMCWAGILSAAEAEWPQWRGPRRDGSWQAPALPEQWPEGGLKVRWKQPLGGGYAGVVVSQGRALTMDRQVEREPDLKDDNGGTLPGKILKEVERVLCVDALTGKPLWEHADPETYGKLDYGNGPRAAPTIVGDRVLTLGALGKLNCLSLQDGRVLWSHDLKKDFKGRPPLWGYSASPLVEGDRVFLFAGGTDGHCLLCLELATGKLLWNSLDDEAGYSWPIIVKREGHTQLVSWTPSHIRSVDISNGKHLWSLPYEVTYGVSIATPIAHEDLVLVCGYWHGSKAIKLGQLPTEAKFDWEENKFLRGLMSQPLYRNGHVYLLDKQYGLTCFELKTGRKLWDDKNSLTPRGRNPQASLVWLDQTDRIIALNSNGELVLARISPSGYVEQSRTDIIDDTWAHPAYFDRFAIARSDTGWVCVELAAAAE